MKRILSEVLRREDGVVQRNRRAGALRIEFIERAGTSPWVLNVFSQFPAVTALKELTGRWMEWRLPARKQGTPTGGWRSSDGDAMERRQRSREALSRTGEAGEDGVRCADHEES